MSEAIRPTPEEWQLISSALSYAMEDRSSYAASYGNKGVEAERAMQLVRGYEAVHLKLFGKPSPRQRDIDMFATWTKATLSELGEPRL